METNESKINTDIYKDPRGTHYFHKSRGFDSSKSKSEAMKDISQAIYNEQDGYYTRNYVFIESIVLTACSCNMIVYRIDTTIL